MSLPLLVLQLAGATTPAADAAPRPAIELHARVRAESLTIEQQGEARLELRAEPSPGPRIEVTGKLPPGERRASNLDLRLDAEVTIADPSASPAPPAAAPPPTESPPGT